MPRIATAVATWLFAVANTVDALTVCDSNALLRALPTDAELLAICKSNIRDTLRNELFHEQLESHERVETCVVSMNDRIRLHTDLSNHVQRRCANIENMKDAYVLLDCDVLGTNGGERSEFWYFVDATNMSVAPEADHRYTIAGNMRAQWEDDEVSARSESGLEIFAYIYDTGASEPVGQHAGILEAGRIGGLSSAYECSRADDWTYPPSGVSRCQRRYICFSED